MAILTDYQEENQEQTMEIIEKEQENSSTLAPKEEEITSSTPKEEKLEPNTSNGLDMENYSWGQSLQEVTTNVPVPQGTKSRFNNCGNQGQYSQSWTKKPTTNIRWLIFQGS
uniref:Uncharacterized protein n=1 Tax=Solanum lycopersicum TaxID=4081 RepID=K4C1F0_SOLLC|nr:protein BOBBER 2-like [Solanum lycopersicum]